MQNCLYRGRVTHRRWHPVEHEFEYSIAWLYVDLDQIPEAIERSWILSSRRWGVATFDRSDHLGSADQPLVDSVRELVHRVSGEHVTGPIRLLTQLRHFGFYFSPVNFYYCFSPCEQYLEAAVAEVSNTPWNERHCYVLHDHRAVSDNTYRFEHGKDFHVSPFMQMDLRYTWEVTLPTEDLHVSLACQQSDRQLLQATMNLRRQTLNTTNLSRTVARYPLAAAQILGAIHLQALRLWMKKCPFYPHPKTLVSTASEATMR